MGNKNTSRDLFDLGSDLTVEELLEDAARAYENHLAKSKKKAQFDVDTDED